MVVVSMGFLASGAATLRIDPLNVLLGLAAIAAIITCAYSVWRVISRRSKMSDQFYRDWNGEAERPGVPHRPGVQEQLLNLTTKVMTIEAEITPNHGGSIKDAVGRIDLRLEAVEADLTRVHERLDNQGQVNVNVHP